MIAAWMLRAAMTALLVALAAWLADAVAQLFGRSRRWIWAGALGAAVLLPVAAQWPPIASLLQLLAVRWFPLQALLAALPHVPVAIGIHGAAPTAPSYTGVANVAWDGAWNGAHGSKPRYTNDVNENRSPMHDPSSPATRRHDDRFGPRADRGERRAPAPARGTRSARTEGSGGQPRPRSHGALFDIRCTSCGVTAQVPFRPIEGRDVFCQPCYRARKPS